MLGKPTDKLILTMLAGVAEFEGEIMLERQREGYREGEGSGEVEGLEADCHGEGE